MKLNSNQLQAFQALCQELSFTRASRSLGLSQPAFSHRISALEDELEVTLFIRDKKGVLLTEEGENLLSYTRKLEGLEEDFLGGFHSPDEGIRGTIRIGGFSSIMRSLVLPAISQLFQKNPHLKLKTYTCELSELSPLLKSSKADMILSNRSVDNPGYENIFLGHEENVLVGHKDFLKKEVYLDHDEEDVTTNSYFKLLGIVPPSQKLYLDDVYGLLDGVLLGLGKAVLPKHLIKNQKLLRILKPKTILKVPVFLSFAKAPYFPEGQKQALKILEKELKKSLAP
ncbi:MAG: LysR family transcriptional regulator [Halobacteriovoraceae bacterium]|nr:LysR family transcriptional regulator [Halobacteriovoraceae bacterium]